ncbi:unnamed protein product [Vicia faba]|uniref:Uncharacterized protein n=1 Tax=Vicia faba TaxID=3906 RepID=A0AAV0YE81_VICFA|nr:unnamed protein product [Vicia faba]
MRSENSEIHGIQTQASLSSMLRSLEIKVADAEALLDFPRSLVGSVKSLMNEGATHSQFVSSLIQRYAPSPNSSVDWQKLFNFSHSSWIFHHAWSHGKSVETAQHDNV